MFTQKQIFEAVWYIDSESCQSSVVSTICNLRRKIEPDSKNPTCIKTVLGVNSAFYNVTAGARVRGQRRLLSDKSRQIVAEWTVPYFGFTTIHGLKMNTVKDCRKAVCEMIPCTIQIGAGYFSK